MPDVTLKLSASPSPASNTPLASGSPVSEARGVGADPAADDSGAFADLLRDSLKAAADAAADAATEDLLAGLQDGEAADDADLQTLLNDPLQTIIDPLAAAMAQPIVLPAGKTAQKPELDVDADADADERTSALVQTDSTGGTARTGKDTADTALQAAGIAAAAERAGNDRPDAALAPVQATDNSAQMAQQTHAADFRGHLAAAQRPATELTVSTPINQQGWADDVGHQVAWLAEQGSGRAELVLTPPHLGRIEISLQIGVDQSSAQFVSASPQVREALEQAMPRLREMLADSGISLGEANVSSDHPSGERGSGGERGHRGRDTLPAEGAVAASARRGVGLVDLFA
jgi:flagellar hook-length control protein FliK